MRFEAFDFPSRRSNVIARNGLVATSQPLAAQVGLNVLQQGGNAIDAAVAAVATLCVVEPTSTGIGGDAFALIWPANEGRLYGLNASGPAPQGLTAEWIRARGHRQMPTTGAIPVTVPGALHGWQLALERFGSMGMDRLLAPAIDYAEKGFPVSQRIARAWGGVEDKMGAHDDSRRVWLPGGGAPRPGELFRNREFAASLRAIAAGGPDVFYQGEIATQIAGCVQTAGGLLTVDDLAAYRAEWVEPIAIDYGNGFTFYEMPPNGQGLTALLSLGIARHFDLRAMGYGTAAYYHTLLEATKLAFADAATYIADPRQVAVPLAGLLSESYASERAATINLKRALPARAGRPPQHGDTVYLSVADGDGNMVSWIQSLYMDFGSGLTAGATGIQLNNRGANFSLEAGHANEAAPGKRPYNTIIPGFITREGEAWSSFGVMGGFMQPQGHLQVGLNLVEFGMDPQSALDAPRVRWLKGQEVAVEPGVPAPVQAELRRRGHKLSVEPATPFFGGGQVIVRRPESGVLVGGSEPRNDGAAVGW